MFNVTVIKIKSIFKYLLTFIIIISIIYMFNRYFYNRKELFNINIGKNIESILIKYSTELINLNLPNIKYVLSSNNEQAIKFNPMSEEDDSAFYENGFMNYLLKLQLGVIDFKSVNLANNNEQIDNIDINNEKQEDNTQDIANNENIEFASSDLETQIATKNPISENYNKQYLNVKIKNETNYELTEEILNHNNLDSYILYKY